MTVGLEALEDLLRVVQDGARGVHLEGAVLPDAVPGRPRPGGPGDPGHVVGEDGAELRLGEERLALRVGQRGVGGADVEPTRRGLRRRTCGRAWNSWW